MGVCAIVSGCGGAGDSNNQPVALRPWTTAQPLTRLTFVAIGDSITSEFGNNALLDSLLTALRARTDLPIRGGRVAELGLTSGNYLPEYGHGYYEMARDAIRRENANIASILLGTNDNQLDVPAAIYQANLLYLSRLLFDDCPSLERIYLHEPPLLGTDATRHSRLLSDYPDAISRLHNGVTIFHGTRGLAAHGLELWRQGEDVFRSAYYDGVHPTPAEARFMAEQIALVMLPNV